MRVALPWFAYISLAGMSLTWAALAAHTQEHTPAQSFDALLKEGFALHEQARFREAIPVLERARTLMPNDYFANLLLGIDRLRTGNARAAIAPLKLAARARPGEGTPEEYLGETLAQLGLYPEAAASYQEAVRREPKSSEALEAWAGFALERFRAVGATLRASDAGVAAIRTLQSTAKSGTAARCVAPIPELERRFATREAGPSSHKQTVEAGRQLSVCYSLAAGRVAEQLGASGEDAVAVDRLRGDVLLLLKEDAAAAEAEYRKGLAVRASDPSLLERLAQAQVARGDAEGARASAQSALRVDPHRREAMRTLAELAMNDRDYAGALPWLRQLADESPADMSVQAALGRALAQTGDAAEAWKHLSQVLQTGFPDEKGALHALAARVLRQLGRDAEADQASAEARRRSDAFQASAKEGGHEKTHADE